MNVSIIGSRGIPAKYGGYEVFAEMLSTRLVRKGFAVTVCCEYNSEKLDSYNGVKLEYLPYPPPKNYTLRKFYEIFNDTYFMIKMARSSNIMYVLGTTAGGMMFLPKLFNWNVKTLVNIGGLEWKRDKWSWLEKLLLWLNTMLAIFFADTVIVDSKAMEKYVGPLGKNKTTFISYGAELPNQITWNKSKLTALMPRCKKIMDIDKNSYWLEVARLEPDNNIHVVLEGYLKSTSRKPLVVIGDYTSKKYRMIIEKILKNDIDKRVFMVGGIYNDRELLNMLRQNCFGYIHAHSFGGTNPSLLEAVIFKNIILANDNEFNKEVCSDYALYFNDSQDLANKIRLIEDNLNDLSIFKDLCYNRVMTNYSWDKIAADYSELLNRENIQLSPL